jgi:hypothetical protein
MPLHEPLCSQISLACARTRFLLSTSPPTDWKRLLPRGYFLAAALAIGLVS